MAFCLEIPIGHRFPILPHQRRSQINIFLPVPETEVVVEHILSRPWTLALCRVPHGIMSRPNSFGTFEIRLADTKNVVEGIHLVVGGGVRGFMKLGNCRDKLCGH